MSPPRFPGRRPKAFRSPQFPEGFRSAAQQRRPATAVGVGDRALAVGGRAAKAVAARIVVRALLLRRVVRFDPEADGLC